MPIYLLKYGIREVISNFMYEDVHLNHVAEAWADQSPHRYYYPPTQWGKCGLEGDYLADLAPEKLPLFFLLPINKNGNHWVSLAVRVELNPAKQVEVHIGFSDSKQYSQDQNPSKSILNAADQEAALIHFQRTHPPIPLPHCIPDEFNEEMDRVSQLFKNVFPECKINEPQIYEHAWFQSDSVSCGPYCLENSIRFLEGRTSEANPGHHFIREKHLSLMRTNETVNTCSNKIELAPDLVEFFTESYCKNALTVLKKACEQYLQYASATSKKQSTIIELLNDVKTGLNQDSKQAAFFVLRLKLQDPKNATFRDLQKNAQSRGEQVLKVLAILSVLFLIVPLIQRLVQTSGKKVNFFKPLSAQLVAKPLKENFKIKC